MRPATVNALNTLGSGLSGTIAIRPDGPKSVLNLEWTISKTAAVVVKRLCHTFNG